MPHHLLIVDDQQDIVRILEREFKKNAAYVCHTALSAAQAFSLLADHAIDLVISDVKIGTDNGFTLLRDLKTRHPQAGLMMMTAYRSPGYRQQAEELGVCFFIEKPFAVNTLLKAVERFFIQRETARTRQLPPTPANTSGNALAHFKPVDLVQLFCLNGRSVLISLNFHPGQHAGRIYIQRGRVLHVEFGSVQGEEAFYQMMKMPHPVLSLQDHIEPVPETVHASWECLLLETARLQDEAQETAEEPAAVPAPLPAAATPVPASGADPFADFWKNVQTSPDTKLKVN
jgi:CheY-like chemotaxis protein